jgi:serpin B
MKKFWMILVSVLALAAMVGCSQPAAAAEQKSSKARESAPVVSQSEAAKLAEGNSTLALNLYQLLKKEGGNLFYSPYSVSEAMAMTYGGARGETAAQMAAALQFLLAQDKLQAAFNSTDIALASREQVAADQSLQGQDGKGFRLKVANAIWGQKGFKFSAAYLDLLAQNYGAGMRIVDYEKATEASRQTINQWVADQTENRIKDLIPPGAVTNMTRLVLTNAIYFNAAWATRFNESQTENGSFSLPDGSKVNVPMMKQYAKHYNYAEDSNYQAIELPYEGQQLSMIILLPREAQFDQFEAALSYTRLNAILAQMESASVDLSMPKFKIESEMDLVKSLQKLGLAAAFDPAQADFSGMTGQKDLYISGVVHKAYVTVDENGTEAAAATGVMMGLTAMPVEIKEFSMDRPFIFLIRDNPTGTLLFMGRVMDPTK